MHQNFWGKESARYSHVSRSKEGLESSDFQKAWSKSHKTNPCHIWKQPSLTSNVLETSKLLKMLFTSLPKTMKRLPNAFKKAETLEKVPFQRKIILSLHTFRYCLSLFQLLTQFFDKNNLCSELVVGSGLQNNSDIRTYNLDSQCLTS